MKKLKRVPKNRPGEIINFISPKDLRPSSTITNLTQDPSGKNGAFYSSGETIPVQLDPGPTNLPKTFPKRVVPNQAYRRNKRYLDFDPKSPRTPKRKGKRKLYDRIIESIRQTLG